MKHVFDMSATIFLLVGIAGLFYAIFTFNISLLASSITALLNAWAWELVAKLSQKIDNLEGRLK